MHLSHGHVQSAREGLASPNDVTGWSLPSTHLGEIGRGEDGQNRTEQNSDLHVIFPSLTQEEEIEREREQGNKI